MERLNIYINRSFVMEIGAQGYVKGLEYCVAILLFKDTDWSGYVRSSFPKVTEI